mmetsp:Transcript_43384/g.125214  ORF Transcript_43384/g.125214 Transcript_43384/m.125214 type:complete len:382 (+) Transcript_43384:47-1192(+)
MRPGSAAKDFRVRDSVDENLPRQVWPVSLMRLTPVVGDSVSVTVSIGTELARGDGVMARVESLQSLPPLLVPEREDAIATSCGEGSVDRVEVDGIDGSNGLLRPMALEREVLPLVAEVVDAAPPFDGAHGVAGLVGEDRQGPGLHPQRREARVQRRRVLLHLPQVVGQDVPVGGAHREHGELRVHGVDALGQLQRRGRRGLARGPEAEGLVPAPRGHEAEVVHQRQLLHRALVPADVLVPLRLQVADPDLLVAAPADQAVAVAREAAAEHRGLGLVAGAGQGLGAVGRDLPDPHALVPGARGKEVAGGPSEAAHAVPWLVRSLRVAIRVDALDGRRLAAVRGGPCAAAEHAPLPALRPAAAVSKARGSPLPVRALWSGMGA